MRIIIFVFVVALVMGDHNIKAQDFGVEYTTELQTNFKDCNFINLLHLRGNIDLGKSISLETATISICKTRDNRLIDDIQIFSNIEEDNMPLALAVCGVSWNLNKNNTFFIGLRNMNEDYFVSPITSFFTNSSCGIYPTISANYPIANYPVASLGLHYNYSAEYIGVQASIYNGVGYNHFIGHDNIFRFTPVKDGIFGLAQIEYHYKKGTCFLGNAVYYNRSMSISPWFYLEQTVTNHMAFLFGYSHSFLDDVICKDFLGLGMKYQNSKLEYGVFSDYANFIDKREWATELTCKVSINEHFYLQPITHIILTENQLNSIFSFRLGLTY